MALSAKTLNWLVAWSQPILKVSQKGHLGLGMDSVQTVVKHRVGCGAAKKGFDSYTSYGRFAAISVPDLPPTMEDVDLRIGGTFAEITLAPTQVSNRLTA
jgi:hypothetical protein